MLETSEVKIELTYEKKILGQSLPVFTELNVEWVVSVSLEEILNGVGEVLALRAISLVEET